VKILYDGEIFQMQSAGGINRYFANIIGALPRDYAPILALHTVRDVNYPSHPNLKLYQFGKMRVPDLSYRLSLYASRLEDAFLRRRLMYEHFDLFHPTYYRQLLSHFGPSVTGPKVVTVWDMIHELFAREMDPTGQYAAEKKASILSAQHIICISESTKRDLLQLYPVREANVSVTYLASAIDESMSHGPERVPDRPYYLYVGSRSSYKNFDRLLQAFAKVISSERDLVLCVVGSPFTADEMQLITDLRLIPNVEHYRDVSDEQLAKLYRCSIALVYPSLYEGFGIPPLEAMSCGTVAIVSNVSSLPEVVGDAGMLFDPTNADELSDMMLTLVTDESLRQEFIERGRRQTQRFSWSKTAAETVAVYRSLVGGI
jgi:glycosyltransferase involved in cell wall biosynthesis